MRIELPLTLAIMPCLLVADGGQRYAIAQKDVDEVVLVHPQLDNQIEFELDQETYRLRGQLLPLVRLSEVLARPATFTGPIKREIALQHREASGKGQIVVFVVLRSGSSRFGLIVDAVLGSEEIVLKPMQSIIRSLPIYSGATILGDGQVVLVLDSRGIAQHASVGGFVGLEDSRRQQSKAAAETQPFLLFESGPAERLAVPLAEIRRIEQFPTAAIERVAEQEFVTLSGVSTKLLRLEQKLEVSRLGSQEAYFVIVPRSSDLPAGLLASRIIDAEALNLDLQPATLNDPAVTGAAIVDGRLTLVLSLGQLFRRVSTTPAGGAGRRRLLVVDDTAFFRQVVSGHLRAAGYEVETAVNGEDAMAQLLIKPFDMIVSDIEMPVMDGYGLARAARAEPRTARLPMLALTSLDSAADRAKSLACGFDRHEVKLDRDRLLAAVGELLTRTQGVAG